MTIEQIAQALLALLPDMIEDAVRIAEDMNEDGDYNSRDRWTAITYAAVRLEVALCNVGYRRENDAQ